MVVVNLAATSCVDPAVLDQKIVCNPQSVMSHLVFPCFPRLVTSQRELARPIKGECLVVVFIA